MLAAQVTMPRCPGGCAFEQHQLNEFPGFARLAWVSSLWPSAFVDVVITIAIASLVDMVIELVSAVLICIVVSSVVATMRHI